MFYAVSGGSFWTSLGVGYAVAFLATLIAVAVAYLIDRLFNSAANASPEADGSKTGELSNASREPRG